MATHGISGLYPTEKGRYKRICYLKKGFPTVSFYRRNNHSPHKNAFWRRKVNDKTPQFPYIIYTSSYVPAWDKGSIRYFGIFHDQVLDSRPHFRNPENFQKGKIYVFRPTRGSGFSRYRVMVKYMGVMLRITRSLVPHVRQLIFPFC